MQYGTREEKKQKSKPLKGHFTEDREEWQKELQSHCEEVRTDLEETKYVQEERIEYFKTKRNQQFSERDGQKTAHGENFHYCEVLSRTIHGTDGITKLVEGCETRLLEESGRFPD